MNFKELRELNGFTQKELGQRIGVTQQYIHKLEKGDIDGLPIGKLKKLSKAFKITELELLEIFLNS